MKKLLSVVMALVLVLAIPFAASAVQSPTGTVKYSVIVLTSDKDAGSASKNVSDDGSVTLTAAPNSAHKFTGWEISGKYTLKSGSLNDATIVIAPTSDIVAVATFNSIYKIITGANQVINSGSTSVKFRGNGTYNSFVSAGKVVKVNGVAISADKFTVNSDGTIELKPEYVKTLPVGTHVISVIYTDGAATTLFTVNADGTTTTTTESKNTSPKTGDVATPVLMIVCLISLAGVGFSAKKAFSC